MYYIGICDDSALVCAYIEQCVTAKAEKEEIIINTEMWSSGEALLKDLRGNCRVDILFLDIELLEMSGIEAAEIIRRQMDDYDMQIIYISGIESYAFDLIKTQPLDFLVKPLDVERIDAAFMLACKLLGKRERFFEYTVGKTVCRIPLDSIYYFCSEGHLIRVVLKEGEKSFYGKIKEIFSGLPLSFYMIHQSYIVNSEYIYKYSYESIELYNGEKLPISKAYRKTVREKLLRNEGI